MKTKIRSVEPKIAELGNGWLKSYGLDYKLEQEPLNAEIDRVLNDVGLYSERKISATKQAAERGWSCQPLQMRRP